MIFFPSSLTFFLVVLFLICFFFWGLKPSVGKIHPYICLILERKKRPESLTTISASAPNHEMDQDEPWQRFFSDETMASKWEVERNLVYINWIKLNWIHYHIAFDLATNKLDGSWLGKCGFRFELILVTHLNSSPWVHLEGTDPPGYLRRIEQFGHFDYSACVGSSVWARSAGRSLSRGMSRKIWT